MFSSILSALLQSRDCKIAGKKCFRSAARIAGIYFRPDTFLKEHAAANCLEAEPFTVLNWTTKSFRESTVPLDGLLGSAIARALAERRLILRMLYLL